MSLLVNRPLPGMNMFVAGSGPPLVLIPGIQGRWEWMRPAVAALARHFQVITFSLVEKGRPAELFDRLVRQVDEALDLGIHLALRAGRISEHDALVGRKLAWILTGGSIPTATLVSEQYLLDLEREAFLSLCGEIKTQERIQYTLKTGKTLRN